MKISIITVCFNSQKTIYRTLESLAKQSYNNIEYIIIDGNSNDNTLSIIKNYKKNIDILISEKDNGIYDAINKGIKLANGEIIGLLHSDDWYANKNVISRVSNVFKNHKVDIVWGDVAMFDDNDIKKGFIQENL